MTSELHVICQESCNNAPRKEILRDFTIALATNDLLQIKEWLHDQVTWSCIGHKQLSGKDVVSNEISLMHIDRPVELKIDHLITHGKTASVNGVVTFENNTQMAFCDVYEFAGAVKTAKIKEITSFRI
ncbi:nuclear transport factor 2 family protein [Ornithinibacillus halotolerans]|uniref:Nuclear transport factor 2 family protein n=1 Tax=Ornithinibacillus halotolerans TaxID=1274357 RepID=A0A916RW06_9BACI|nr:nuclear transport factor 2 family protein [Ornithinibacillus halotolerans]GGA73830.1 hypothetical protein GCM10008025_16910 [Ornithinibacillus halotolerans]